MQYFFKFGIENRQLLKLSPVIMFNPDNTIILLKEANTYVWHLIPIRKCSTGVVQITVK